MALPPPTPNGCGVPPCPFNPPGLLTKLLTKLLTPPKVLQEQATGCQDGEAAFRPALKDAQEGSWDSLGQMRQVLGVKCPLIYQSKPCALLRAKVPLVWSISSGN